jgi:hypothetical protein
MSEPWRPMYELINELVTAVESQTETISREEYREFLQELQSDVEMRLDALRCDDAMDARRAR